MHCMIPVQTRCKGQLAGITQERKKEPVNAGLEERSHSTQ